MKMICENEPTPIELTESIEQMKYLELGGDILSVNTFLNFTSINLPSDVEKVLETIESSSIQKQLVTQIMNYESWSKAARWILVSNKDRVWSPRLNRKSISVSSETHERKSKKI